MATSIPDTNDELWRECAQWLTSWKMIRNDHKVNMLESKIVDFANILRDGVLLCKLLNKIDPGCIDMKSINLKPTMAQFLCLHNISIFLTTCQNTFFLKPADLFESTNLFNLTNFHKVLCTLSKLSLHPKAQQVGVRGFYVQKDSSNEEDAIYQGLQLEDLPARSRSVTDDYEAIYHEIVIHPTTKSEEASFTFEKRDYVINELLETEKNYVDVLTKLRVNFMGHFKNKMNIEHHKTVFLKIEELHETHTDFYKELCKIRNNLNFDSSPKLANIFMDFRNKFLVYGEYCANLQRATTLLQDLCDSDDEFNKTVLAQEKDVNNGKFKLRDVLSVPMQRILKYHLLLEKLIENTNNNHEEYIPLQRARETMLDVAGYINEVARDSDSITVINNVQKLITEWRCAQEISLLDYGKLLKDCDLKMLSHKEPRRTKSRYVFIFQKCILICKSNKGSYLFRDILKLDDYHIEKGPNRTVLREARFMSQFILVKNDESNVVTFFLRTAELKEQIVKKLEEAINDLKPDRRKGCHTTELTTFKEPTTCHYCSKFLKGLIFQGYKCTSCNLNFHKQCLGTSRCSGSFARNKSNTLNREVSNKDKDPLQSKLWFVGEMDRTTAESKLKNRESGTFLVRIRPQSDERDKYALSLKTSSMLHPIKHMKIMCSIETPDSIKYFLSQSKFFNSIDDLIINYQYYSLKENFDKLDDNTKLEWSFKQLYALVIKEFHRGDISELSLVKGSHIHVTSREGYKDGWWRGYNDKKEVGYFPKEYVNVEKEAVFDSM